MTTLKEMAVRQAIDSVDSAFLVLQSIVTDSHNGLRVSKAVLERIQTAMADLTLAQRNLK